MRVKIEVTERDIRLGRPWTCNKCPIARAVSRAVKCKVMVGRQVVAIDGCGVLIPPTAQKFITGFDYPKLAARFVKPFSFTLNIPAKLVKAGTTRSDQ